MFGLVVLIVMVLYLALLVWATRRGWRWGIEKKGWTGKKRYLGAAIGFFIVYLPVFWDFIPTVAVHQYYCAKDSGFWVYKTLDQWKAENPGVILSMEGRFTDMQKEADGYTEIHRLNQRFDWVIKLHEISSVLQLAKRDEALVDTKNNEALIRFVDFSRGNQRSTGTSKFWLVNSDCNGGEIFRVRMGRLIDEIYATAKGDKK